MGMNESNQMTTTRINWKVTNDDAVLVHKIVRRAARMLERRPDSDEVSLPGLEMDVTAAHVNGCPLRLAELLAAEDLDFAHDVFGIRRHIDRKTGKLGDGFVPRFAKHQ
jgi:hypothetical protein